MYVEAVILGIIIGFVRNGRLSNFFEAQFKGWTLSFLALLLFLMPYLLKVLDVSYDKLQIFPYFAMVIIALIALFNFQKTGMKILLVGLLLNLVVMGLSDYKMPVDATAMEALGFDSFVESMDQGEVVNYVRLEETNAIGGLLGKVIPLPKAYPFAKVLSFGDIIVSVGIAFILQYEMLLSSLKSRGSMVQFSYNTKLRRRG